MRMAHPQGRGVPAISRAKRTGWTRLGTTALAAVALVGLTLPAGAQAEPPAFSRDYAPAPGRDLGRDVLGADDGWAAEGAGTTGGAAADDARVFTVRTRAQLAAALDGGSPVPKIIYVRGTIDANTDAQGRPLSCADYATDGYTTQKYLTGYDPRTWGGQKPAGPQEEARAASAARQAERVELAVGSNTTLVGVGRDAVLKGASLQVKDASNVIVRNLELRDAYDCFPVWQPNTGGLGDWKTAYDNIWLRGANHVWVDHVTISDKGHPDAAEPTYFGRNYLRHDGLLDITNGSDLVTVSWSRFADHDKAMLIGNGDNVTTDRGKLRVTLHHNSFKGVVQRAPRVRFGQVHIYNNAYDVPEGADYRYSWGVSTESRIYAENNAFTTPGHVEAADLVKSWNGSALHQSGSEFNGYPVDLLAIHNSYNSGSERDLEPDVGWTPALHGPIDGAAKAAKDVARGAGAGRIG
ncbi:pectate lyase family protein [Streptomyces milbemycinicus]|uniref:pectate lyase family protein n=1 Tax=Streptomyces milbemycinicus TaxID=476552 RepID=UPI0033ED2EBA